MNDTKTPIYVKSPAGLPLVNERGKAFLGLKKSSSPELSGRAADLFDHLNGKLGFADNEEGKSYQECFNLLLRCAYPEVMIDLADLVFVRHERPMVFLNLEHIHMNLQSDPDPGPPPDFDQLYEQMNFIFQELAGVIKNDSALFNDSDLVRLLSESYSHYLYETSNFPWEDPLKDSLNFGDKPVLDVATGLVGFSLIHDWPDDFPKLYLTDSMPFIIEGLKHYKNLVGKNNVEILSINFPDEFDDAMKFGTIHVSKFLHHLEREKRSGFLRRAMDRLEPGGVLYVIDTNLENQILEDAKNPEYKEKLMPGYLETLVSVETDFCENLVKDIEAAGFVVEEKDVNEFHDETDAYSHYPGENLPLKFTGAEIIATAPSGG